MIDAAAFRRDVKLNGLSRRTLLTYAAALAATPALALRAAAQPPAAPKFDADPFTLGVASGDPTPTGAVLWTRLAPKPLEPTGGMAPGKLDVLWEVADDEAFKTVVQSGKAVAGPVLGHSVHVEVEGLQPDRWYFYRFRCGGATSPTGRTRTAPAPDAVPEKLRFAFASCSHWEQGLFTAYGHLAKENVDLAFHLGDYIYEGGGVNSRARKHTPGKLYTLADYRARHAQYKTDENLRAAHAACPWVVTWDDHEFENNYANEISQTKGIDPAEFLLHRAAAYQAYYENMPLRKAQVPHGPDMKLYRTVRFGKLAAFHVLDTRQYRTDQPNGDGAKELNEAALDPKNTILGAEQAAWLKSAAATAPGTWTVLAQQVMMGMVGRPQEKGEPRYSMDQWPGYAHERMGLMRHFADAKVPNPVVLTGDIHSNWVNDLRVDDRKPETPVVAAEFVGTSISSGGNGIDPPAGADKLLAANPCIKFHNRQRGYVSCTVTPKEWRADYRIVAEVTKPGGDVATKASFVVEAGKPGVQKA